MGTEYYVACKDCKVVRELDKFYALCDPAENREQMIKLSEELKKTGWAFRSALLVSFMWKHKGHNCTVFSEHDEECEELHPYDYDKHEYPRREKVDFWKPDFIPPES